MRAVSLLLFPSLLLASVGAHALEQPELTGTKVVRGAGLVVLRGRLDNGEEVDLCTLGKVSVEREGSVKGNKDGLEVGGKARKVWSEEAEREFDKCVEDASACVLLGNSCEFLASKVGTTRLMGVAVAVDARGSESLDPKDLAAVKRWQDKMLAFQASIITKLDGQTAELGLLRGEVKRVADQFNIQTQAMVGLTAAVVALIKAPGRVCERTVSDEAETLRTELAAVRKVNQELQTRIDGLSSAAVGSPNDL